MKKADHDLECGKCHTIIPQGDNFSTQAEFLSNRTTVLCVTCKKKVDEETTLMWVLIIVIFVIAIIVITYVL